MVALGEYKFRIANKSLHKSRFFVRRPSRDIKFLGIRLIKGKKTDIQLPPDVDDTDDVDPDLETIMQKKSEMENYYESAPLQQNRSLDDNQRPGIIEEEPSRKVGTAEMYSTELKDLYGDKPSPMF